MDADGVLLVHALGGGDLGYQPRVVSGGPPDLVGEQSADADARPLRKVFKGLADAGVEVDGVLLVGTTNEHRPGARPFAAYARDLRDLLCRPEGLFGVRFEAGQVRVVETAQPTAQHTAGPVRQVLGAVAPRECLLTFGSGPYAPGVGALLAAIETRVPVRLVPVDAAARPFRISDLLEPGSWLRDWLVRHRLWDELAEVHSENSDVWSVLAARQRVDPAVGEALVRAGGGVGVTVGQAQKLSKLWPSVQAAFFERIARGEAIDQSLLRSWYTEQLHRWVHADRDTLPGPAREAVNDLVLELTSFSNEKKAPTLIREAQRRLEPYRNSGQRTVDLVLDEELTALYGAATSHRTHLGGDRYLPRTIAGLADEFVRSDPARTLLRRRGLTPWPVVGGGDVLVLMSVGLSGPDPDVTDQQRVLAMREVIAYAVKRRNRQQRRGRVRLRLLATEESEPQAQSLATSARRTLGPVVGEVEVVTGFLTGPEDVPAVRDRLWKALESAAAPTGLPGSGSLRDVDEVVLVVNPGKAVVNYGMIIGGIGWSLRAACPLRMVALGRRRGIEPVLSDGGRVLHALAADRVLARVAAGAVSRLDLRTAVRLLGQGSAALDPAKDEVDALHRALYAGPGEADARTRARQRLTLVAEALGGHPWAACYLAVETLRPSLFPWGDKPDNGIGADGTWPRLMAESSALRDLNALRNRSPFTHLLDKIRRTDREGGGRPPRRPGTDVPELIARTIADLPSADPADAVDDDVLLRTYERVIRGLSTH